MSENIQCLEEEVAFLLYLYINYSLQYLELLKSKLHLR